ncbi:MAG: hypothetical protein ACAF41_04255 [Leptolyngbya sp. BL-A-14]
MKRYCVRSAVCGTVLGVLLLPIANHASERPQGLIPDGFDRAVQSPSRTIIDRTNALAAAFEPTSVYQQASVNGFTVLINPSVLKHPPQAKAMWQELNLQLNAIVRVMPAKPLAALRKVRLWVEWANREGAAEFHPSAVWLSQHGYNPDKAGGVEVSNTRNFVQWSHTDQPWMLLHELAHAYHFRVLGDTYGGIQRAYQHAVQQGLYQSVAYVKGGKKKAYALTNETEYFAELSEAYFGKNDFYPFTRAELKTYDPVGYQLMQTAWGKL